MGVERLTERQVIGEFYKTLAVDTGASWINDVSNYFKSDQAYEEYAWLGQSPQMREWVGGRLAKKLTETSFTIRNKHYESTMEVLVKDLRRDKSGQVMLRIQEQARRANTHWATLLSNLIINGAATTCYDGQYFFDTDHSEGSSGTQSNSISADISGYPVATHGTTTAPAVGEAQSAIVEGVNAILGFKDDQGEPMNEDASSFTIMSGLGLSNALRQAIYTPVQVAESQTALQAFKTSFSMKHVTNIRMNSMTTSFVIFRTDSNLKSFIRQEEMGVQVAVVGKGSTHEIMNKSHLYAIDAWRNVGYGMWQNACLVTFI